MKKYLWTFLFVFCVYGKSPDFTLEYFSREVNDSSYVSQKGRVLYGEVLNIESFLDFQYNIELSFGAVNSEQYFGKDDEDDFNVDISEFFLDYKFLNNHLNVGIQGTENQTIISEQVNGPGIKFLYNKKNIQLSSSLLTIPSQRKFYISGDGNSDLSQVWSNSFVSAFDFKFGKAEFNLNYDYFSNLGPKISFQSGLRGNQTQGTDLDSEFLYDYSIYSGMLVYEFIKFGLKFSPYLSASLNESAFEGENHYTEFGLSVDNENSIVKFSSFRLESEAMIASFTPKYLDMTGISGYQGIVTHNYSKQVFYTASFANFYYIDSGESAESISFEVGIRQ